MESQEVINYDEFIEHLADLEGQEQPLQLESSPQDEPQFVTVNVTGSGGNDKVDADQLERPPTVQTEPTSIAIKIEEGVDEKISLEEIQRHHANPVAKSQLGQQQSSVAGNAPGIGRGSNQRVQTATQVFPASPVLRNVGTQVGSAIAMSSSPTPSATGSASGSSSPAASMAMSVSQQLQSPPRSVVSVYSAPLRATTFPGLSPLGSSTAGSQHSSANPVAGMSPSGSSTSSTHQPGTSGAPLTDKQRYEEEFKDTPVDQLVQIFGASVDSGDEEDDTNPTYINKVIRYNKQRKEKAYEAMRTRAAAMDSEMRDRAAERLRMQKEAQRRGNLTTQIEPANAAAKEAENQGNKRGRGFRTREEFERFAKSKQRKKAKLNDVWYPYEKALKRGKRYNHNTRKEEDLVKLRWPDSVHLKQDVVIDDEEYNNLEEMDEEEYKDELYEGYHYVEGEDIYTCVYCNSPFLNKKRVTDHEKNFCRAPRAPHHVCDAHCDGNVDENGVKWCLPIPYVRRPDERSNLWKQKKAEIIKAAEEEVAKRKAEEKRLEKEKKKIGKAKGGKHKKAK